MLSTIQSLSTSEENRYKVWLISPESSPKVPVLRLNGQPLLQRFAVAVMLVAALAFALQATFISAWEAATGENTHYNHADARAQSVYQGFTSHIVTHVHADGTMHQHAVVDDDGALALHSQQPGCPCCWNMAVVVGVLPSLVACGPGATVGHKLVITSADPCCGTEPHGPRRPPRPTSIA
jgi:hypothetical protein